MRSSRNQAILWANSEIGVVSERGSTSSGYEPSRDARLAFPVGNASLDFLTLRLTGRWGLGGTAPGGLFTVAFLGERILQAVDIVVGEDLGRLGRMRLPGPSLAGRIAQGVWLRPRGCRGIILSTTGRDGAREEKKGCRKYQGSRDHRATFSAAVEFIYWGRFQSLGGNATRQKPGAGRRNSMPTSVGPFGFF